MSFPLACLGGAVGIDRLVGKRHEVEIPDGVQPGDTIRLKGEGMPRLGGRGAGDLIVHVTINVPRKPDKAQRDAIEKLAKHFPDEADLTKPGEGRRETRNRKKGSGFFDRIRDALEGE